MTHPQLARSVVMVRPTDFCYNAQTGADNEFQHKPAANEAHQITDQALSEFANAVDRLGNEGLDVIVLDKAPTDQRLPDAVFPNNWFSTRADGSIIVYPMKTPNRQAEVQLDPLINALNSRGYQVGEVVDLRQQGLTPALEGTGSLIFHHPRRQLFAAISERCDESRLRQFAARYDWQVWPFDTRSSGGGPIYHTNVLMSVGEAFAVICQEVIANDARARQMIRALEDCVEDLIVISEAQMAKGFCANILQLENASGDPLIAMSASAWKHFTPTQKKILEKHGTPVPCNIDTIERVGGGSMRCMLAENFLRRADK